MRDEESLLQTIAEADTAWQNRHGRQMITVAQYFGNKINHPDATPECVASATELLKKVNGLLDEARAEGVKIFNDPDTGTQISGAKGGDGDGGFRLQSSATGAPLSGHKTGHAVDVYDIGDRLDKWITRDKLIKHGLYREAAPFTLGWCHLTDRAPKSGNRSYIP